MASYDVVVSTRERRTNELLANLAKARNPTEKGAITAVVVRLNLGLCDALANRFLQRGIERDDLVQVARLALIKAINRFSFEAGSPFISFAVPTITGELKRHFRDHGWMVRPPRAVQEQRARVQLCSRELESSLGRPATQAELVRASGLPEPVVSEALTAGAGYRPVSLDAPVAATEGHTTLGDLVPSVDSAIDSVTDRLSLHAALAALEERDRQIIGWRYGEGLTQSEIGARLGVSQMQVSRILRRILKDLRRELLEEGSAGLARAS